MFKTQIRKPAVFAMIIKVEQYAKKKISASLRSSPHYNAVQSMLHIADGLLSIGMIKVTGRKFRHHEMIFSAFCSAASKPSGFLPPAVA